VTRSWPLVLALVAISVGGWKLADRAARPADKPRLALLTSLPLLFAEDFSLDAPKVAAVARIEERFVITPIATADAVSLKGQSLLLMAHPRAQPAEVLVELDAWVRRGGQMVLLADPSLQWESSRPLGDRLRPPPGFADTGLLRHWGLIMMTDGSSQGQLRATEPRCSVSERGLIARCAMGRGGVSVIADADFIMQDGKESDRLIDLMMDELSRAKSS